MGVKQFLLELPQLLIFNSVLLRILLLLPYTTTDTDIDTPQMPAHTHDRQTDRHTHTHTTHTHTRNFTFILSRALSQDMTVRFYANSQKLQRLDAR